MILIIKICASLAGIGSLVVGILLYYGKQTPAIWTTFATLVFVVLAFCLFWQNSINLKNKENLSKKSNYARLSVIKQMSTAYNYLFEASKHSIKPMFSSSETEKYNETKIYLGYLNDSVEKLDKLVVQNNVAIDESTMSYVSKFIENINVLQKLLAYFSELYNPGKKEYDFVSNGPFSRMRELETIIQKLKIDFPEAIADTDAGVAKSVNEIEALWEEVDKIEGRLCLSPEKYKWKVGRVPNVFNKDNMKRLPVPNIPNAKAYLSFGYE